MSIDARITAVTRILPGDCGECKNTGKDPETNWDDCPRCHGTSAGRRALRLHLEPRLQGGSAGQTVLTIINPPVSEMEGLVGADIWGCSSYIYMGEKKWAKRIGYTQIEML